MNKTERDRERERETCKKKRKKKGYIVVITAQILLGQKYDHENQTSTVEN